MVHNFADVIKLLMKENITPTQANGFYYLLAPFWSMTVSAFAAAGDSSGRAHGTGGTPFRFQAANFSVGFFIFFPSPAWGFLE